MPKLFGVFISYGRKDSKDFAIQLNDELTKQGFRVWFDLNDMPRATEFQKEIDEAIEKSHNFVFIIANHAVKSEYCYQEIELAVKLNKHIILSRFKKSDFLPKSDFYRLSINCG